MQTFGEYEAFEQYDVQVGAWRVHYVDTGTGPPVLMIHGSPTSSYAFRQQIAALSSRFRVVAPDLLGFGQSEGPEEGASFPQQADMLCALLDHLSLGAFRLIGHNWGGPIGVGCAVRRLEDVQQLVLINTTILANFKPPGYWKPFTLWGIGNLLLVRLNLFSRGLPLMMRAARSSEVQQAYAQPLKARGLRQTVLALERLEGFGELMSQVATKLPRLADIPALIIWGHPDAYFRAGELERLKDLFPAATVHEIPGGGHFPQEDAPDAVTGALLDFLD